MLIAAIEVINLDNSINACYHLSWPFLFGRLHQFHSVLVKPIFKPHALPIAHLCGILG